QDRDSGSDTDKGEDTESSEATEKEVVKETNTVSSAKTRVQPYIASEMNGMIILADGTVFDPEYYANMHPELVALYGNDKYALLEHYLTIGKNSGMSANEQEEQAKAAAAQAAAGSSDSEEDEEDTGDDSSTSSSNSSSAPTVTYSLGPNNELYMGGTQVGTYDPNTNYEPITITQTGTVNMPITIGNNTYSLNDINHTSIPDGANFTSSNYDVTYDSATSSFSGSFANVDGLYEIMSSNATRLSSGGYTASGPNNTVLSNSAGQGITYKDSSGTTWNVGSYSVNNPFDGYIDFNDGTIPNNPITPNRTINPDGTVS
ncbi:MAG: hypothetical protein IK123_01750, partial [Lachnospiraceae bacterium]|nr:hypothetical protein [Lachnospiraceae bacterium]